MMLIGAGPDPAEGRTNVHVMLPEVSSPAAGDAAERLVAAGYEVHTCRQPHDTGFACVALRGEACPLESFPVDVVVDIRPSTPQPTPFEDGAICGARRRIPLVVAGDTSHNPFLPWTVTEIEGSGVVPAVEAAASMTMPAHSTIGTEVLRTCVRAAGGMATSVRCEVRRRNGRLKVTLFTEPTMHQDTARMAVVHVTQALRAYDPWAAGIDVSVPSL